MVAAKNTWRRFYVYRVHFEVIAPVIFGAVALDTSIP
jgi:hypothetical protein